MALIKSYIDRSNVSDLPTWCKDLRAASDLPNVSDLKGFLSNVSDHSAATHLKRDAELPTQKFLGATAKKKARSDDHHPKLNTDLMVAILGWQQGMGQSGLIGDIRLREVPVRIMLEPWSAVKGLGALWFDHKTILSVQCGTGKWLNEYDYNVHKVQQSVFDLSCFSRIKGKQGGIVNLDDIYATLFDGLFDNFDAILKQAKEQFNHTNKSVHICFWCKRGRHRSYALLIFFLMWAARVHVASYMVDLLQPRLEDIRREAVLTREIDLTPDRKKSLHGAVLFGDLVDKWEAYLNEQYPKHALCRQRRNA